jgi:hypothetical protein
VRPTLPKKVDEITTLAAIGHEGNRMRYELVVDVGSGKKLPSDFLPEAKKEVAQKVCSSAMKKSLDIGASYEYTYREPNHSRAQSFSRGFFRGGQFGLQVIPSLINDQFIICPCPAPPLPASWSPPAPARASASPAGAAGSADRQNRNIAIPGRPRSRPQSCRTAARLHT